MVWSASGGFTGALDLLAALLLLACPGAAPGGTCRVDARVAPQHGLYTVIIAGFLVALLGGARFNITGPTAAFVVVLVPRADQFDDGEHLAGQPIRQLPRLHQSDELRHVQRRHQSRSVRRSSVREPRDLTRPPLASLSRRGAEADRLFDLDE